MKDAIWLWTLEKKKHGMILLKKEKGGKVPAWEIYPKQNYSSKINIKWQAEAKEFIANRPVL